MKRKYGKIETQLTQVTEPTTITIIKDTRAFSLINSGSRDCVLEFNGIKFTLLAGLPLVFGGYDDSVRINTIEVVEFLGVPGNSLLHVFRDVFIEKANYIE